MNVMMISMMAFFVSCSKDNDVEEPTPAPTPTPDVKTDSVTTYTVMLYGTGGGDLDKMLAYNLEQIDALGKKSRVNFTALVKFSKPYQTKVECEGTRLLTQTKDSLVNERKYDANYRLDNPEHLANFIKETKEKLPASKYILVLWNHGNEFGASDKPVQDSYPEGQDDQSQSRAALLDDNTGYIMSTYEMEKGIKDSGTKLDLIYFDACLMGMAETYCQLKDCSKYIMAAAHLTPGVGGNYAKLFTELEEKDSLTDAIKAYVPAAVTDWKNSGAGSADLSCYDMQYMDEFTQNVKSAATEALRLKKELTEISPADEKNEEKLVTRNNWYGKTEFGVDCGGIIYTFADGFTSVDLYSLLTRMASTFTDGTLSNTVTQLRTTLDKMTVANAACGLPQWMDRVSMGVNWPNLTFIDKAEKYEQPLRSSAFCKATGWDKLLFDTENPVMSYMASAYTDNYFFYEQGEQPKFSYAWDVTVSTDMSKIKPEDKELVETAMQNLNAVAAQRMADKKFPLLFSSDILTDLYIFIELNYHESLWFLGIDKVKIKAQLREGETINPNDPYAASGATSVEKEFEIEEE